MTVVGSHHTAFQVADLARSVAFYRDLLGFEVVWERVNREEYVREIIRLVRSTMEQNDGTAQSTLARAKAAVDNIG